MNRPWSSDRGHPGGGDAALELVWGAHACERCGSTVVLGDEVVRLEHNRKTLLCSSCAAQPAETASWEARRAAFDALAASLEDDSIDTAA